MSDEFESQDAGLPASVSQHKRALASVREGPLSVEMASSEDPERIDEVNVLDYWRMIVKRRWTVLMTTAIVLCTAVIGTLLMTPIYRATATLQIERDTMQVVQVEGFNPAESPADRDFFQTQYDLLRSRSLAQRIISELDLENDPDYVAMTAPSPWRALLGMVREEDSAELTPEEVVATESARQTRMINAFLERLSVEPMRNSRLVKVHFDSPSPGFSQRVVNAIAEGYIASNLERRFNASSYAKTFLEERLEQLRLQLEESETRLVEFAQRERIVDAVDGSSLSTQSLAELNSTLAAAQDQRIRAEARWKQAESSSGMGLGAVLGSELIQTLQARRADLQAQYQDKLSVFKPAFPEMQQLQAQVDEIDRQIAAEVANIKDSIRGEYQAALAQEQLLLAQIDALKDEVLDLRNRSIEYNILRREVDTNRQQYDALLQRYKEIGVAGGVGTNNISIVDAAELPLGKYKPRLTLNLALGMLLGLFAGVLLALLFEMLDDSVKSPEDVEKLLGQSVLGVIPLLKAPMTPAKAFADPRSAFAEAYRSVRTALQFATDNGVPRSLLVTSAAPAEGKSTTAMTLAKNFAQLGKRVLIIDADLRNPSLHRILTTDHGAGLSNYLSGAAKAMEVIVQTEVPNLSFMSSGPLPPNPAELLMGAKMLALVRVASDKFDQVIIDGPPVMGLADAPILANMCSGTLLVVEAGGTRVSHARNALKRLQAARAHVIGALLTKFNAKVSGYAYGGYNYYSYGGAESPKKLARG